VAVMILSIGSPISLLYCLLPVFLMLSVVTPLVGFATSIPAAIFSLRNMAKIENQIEKTEERKLLRRPLIFVSLATLGFLLNIIFMLKMAIWIFFL
jgi:hypothetical protein